MPRNIEGYLGEMFNWDLQKVCAIRRRPLYDDRYGEVLWFFGLNTNLFLNVNQPTNQSKKQTNNRIEISSFCENEDKSHYFTF